MKRGEWAVNDIHKRGLRRRMMNRERERESTMGMRYGFTPLEQLEILLRHGMSQNPGEVAYETIIPYHRNTDLSSSVQ